jgi:hypothetical protein
MLPEKYQTMSRQTAIKAYLHHKSDLSTKYTKQMQYLMTKQAHATNRKARLNVMKEIFNFLTRTPAHKGWVYTHPKLEKVVREKMFEMPTDMRKFVEKKYEELFEEPMYPKTKKPKKVISTMTDHIFSKTTDEIWKDAIDLNVKMRGILNGWLADVYYKIHDKTTLTSQDTTAVESYETLTIAALLVDRYIEKNSALDRSMLQKVGCAALCVASNLMEDDDGMILFSPILVHYSDHTYTQEQIDRTVFDMTLNYVRDLVLTNPIVDSPIPKSTYMDIAKPTGMTEKFALKMTC